MINLQSDESAMGSRSGPVVQDILKDSLKEQISTGRWHGTN